MSALAAANQASASVRARDLQQASAHHPDPTECASGVAADDESEDTKSHKDAICGLLEASSLNFRRGYPFHGLVSEAQPRTIMRNGKT
eukprot:CAMPEP_0183595838 /NCGR_PEP_ID=MMETSP0371-20130417/174093_1 /TAXON_ID=268820 /ORGANISM="Peridinium aciculiferum, Strain PAER-2" /LENGTH=87 /DNA_ID=CAMNT_0025807657 /DNA_START=9 /DNA_END=270 /DNA_ORIENTATION=+